ncbi:hypothetical protein [Nonomuraea sp. bgisy101]|uniref:hypothetical protein n=1 Tax=Nonomuraea sp. bgisy101 TaxID=3413784 RepID=UPI003D7273F3
MGERGHLALRVLRGVALTVAGFALPTAGVWLGHHTGMWGLGVSMCTLGGGPLRPGGAHFRGDDRLGVLPPHPEAAGVPWFLAGLVAVTVLSWALAVASSRSAGKGGPGRSARPGPPQSTT